MKIKFLTAILAASFIINTNVLAAQNFVAEGEMRTTISDSKYNINPWNTLTVKGVGEDGSFKMYTSKGVIDIPLDYPLYRINDYYCDKIVCRNGVWGIERNVAIAEFDGNEEWEIVKKQSLQNDNTVIFRCDKAFDTAIKSGISNYFDVYTYEKMKSTRYDGISFDESGSGILMRFMNVRNIKTIDELKTYLAEKKSAGNSVKFFYPAVKADFEAFNKDMQERLNEAAKSNSLGYSDSLFSGFTEEKTYSANSDFFTAEKTEGTMDIFLSCVKNVEVFNGGTEKFSITSATADKNGFAINITGSNGTMLKCKEDYGSLDFLTPKTTVLKFSGTGSRVVKMDINLSGVKAFTENITDIEYKINESCSKKAQAVIPLVIYASEGTTLDFRNSLLYSNEGGKTDTIEIYDAKGKKLSKNGVFKYDGEDTKLYALVNGTVKTYFEIKSGAEAKDKTIMFLGDSIINQNYYSDDFVKMYGENGNVKTIGTLGNKTAMHEGRGGWSAMDYCREKSKYGYTNPFLNNGKFDFEYYMKNNKFENVDAVVINLGINDLNIAGHNTHEEILGYFDEIVSSIKKYNSDVEIIINAPEILFRSESTNAAANVRMNFSKELFGHYRDIDNVTVTASYLNLNGEDDFKYVEPSLNEDNSSLAMYVSDTTHPNVSGYGNLARGTYDAVNFVFD